MQSLTSQGNSKTPVPFVLIPSINNTMGRLALSALSIKSWRGSPGEGCAFGLRECDRAALNDKPTQREGESGRGKTNKGEQ
jgi:hypothetical protein